MRVRYAAVRLLLRARVWAALWLAVIMEKPNHNYHCAVLRRYLAQPTSLILTPGDFHFKLFHICKPCCWQLFGSDEYNGQRSYTSKRHNHTIGGTIGAGNVVINTEKTKMLLLLQVWHLTLGITSLFDRLIPHVLEHLFYATSPLIENILTTGFSFAQLRQIQAPIYEPSVQTGWN
jgi:hypothetical protein